METSFVGRQPIFDDGLGVYGYELLFRTVTEDTATVTDGNQATTNVILNSLTDIGFESLVGSTHAFINLTRGILLNEDLSVLPADQVVLEVLEDIEPDPPVLEALNELRSDGYTIALDDFIYSESLEPLIELADLVKIEFPLTPPSELPQHVARLRELGVETILAEKVETQDEFALCREAGCDLFQGYFFCRPQVLSGRRVQSSVAALVRLMSELQEPEITAKDVERIIQTDANLSFKLLRFINSANTATNVQIESIQHASALIGIRRLRSLASMMLMDSMDENKPRELITVAMTRAKMCELIAENADQERPERFYTVGLLSVMDAMLDLPMDEVVAMLPLSDEINNALLLHEGDMGSILKSVTDYESGESYGTTIELSEAYFQSLRWATECCRTYYS